MLCSYSRKDQEEQGQCQVQGPLQQIPVHTGHHRQGEGWEAEAVPATRSVFPLRVGATGAVHECYEACLHKDE